VRLLRHISLRALATIVVLLAIAAITGVMVVRSGWFHEYLRERILQELERSTGGRAELSQLIVDWQGLTAQVSGLVVHGTEPPEEAPLVRVESATVGLRVLSVLEQRVDLASLDIVRPHVNVIVYPDGSTNFPGAGGSIQRTWAEELLNLRVGRYTVTEGDLQIDARRLPLAAQGENLTVRLTYDPRGPAYDGTVSADKVRIVAAGLGPIEASMAATVRLEQARAWFQQLRLATGDSQAELSGTIENLISPHGTFDTKATVAVAEALKYARIPIAPQGTLRFDGTFSFDTGALADFQLNGRIAAAGLSYTRDRIKIRNASLQAAIHASSEGASLSGIGTEVLGAKITGNARLPQWKRLSMEGEIEGLGLREAAGVVTSTAIPWSGTLAGKFDIDAAFDETAPRVNAQMGIAPSGDGIPVEGQIQAAYDQAAGTVELGPSWVATPATRVDLSGTLGRTLQVRAQTTNLDDLLPALALAGATMPPLQLRNGTATADGTVTGALDKPHFAGQVNVTHGVVQGHAFDRVNGQIEADRSTVRATRITLARGATEVTGSASLEGDNLAAALNLRNANVAELLKEAGSTVEAAGMASATVRLSGTVSQPQADVTADVTDPQAFGERFSRLQTTLRYRPDALEIVTGDAFDGNSSIRFSGSYRPNAKDWSSGALAFDAATQSLPVTRFAHVASMHPPIEAVLTGRVRGSGQVARGGFALESAQSDLAIDRVRVDRQEIGNLALAVETRDAQLQVHATGKVRESVVDATGSWRLDQDGAGSVTIRFSRLSIASLHDLVMIGGDPQEQQSGVPFEGSLEGGAKIDVALRKPQDFRAEVSIDTLQLNAKPSQALRLGVQPQDLVLKNNRPVIADVSLQEARLRQAEFTGRDTSIQASGAIPLRDGANADLAVRGNINLILLQLLNPDLLARGDATVQTSIRGNIRNPSVNGRLELKGASLYLADLPNGIDNANGVVLFDRNRATIERLTAETGGGTVSLGGVLDFGGALTYRLQADAQQVRVRYPEDLSTTFNAKIALNGTSESSTMSGALTLNRATFNPRTDLGQLLAQASRPIPTQAAPNEYLRGLQFDVRIESGPNFEFETSLTRDVQAEVDLHLRGTPLRPVLLGAISVNQGEVEIFGNRYTIDRGDVRFLNPVKIEPSFDMDLETRARGITVNISMSGTMQKLKWNYNSDPPLQSSEIIALLAVGRDPASSQLGASAGPATGSSSFVEAGSGLLGQAVSAQLSSRLQRFFGASRVKIDPTLTGVDNLPQARLTLEQQVSKDVTMTYITNLNRTQEQIVRLQWDFDRNWSAVAVRDQNGLFGIDVQYRKRF